MKQNILQRNVKTNKIQFLVLCFKKTNLIGIFLFLLNLPYVLKYYAGTKIGPVCGSRCLCSAKQFVIYMKLEKIDAV